MRNLENGLTVETAKDNQQWDHVVIPSQGWSDFNLGETWRSRDLIFMLVKRDFVSVYKQTVLGPLWFVIQPVATTLVFVLLFGTIARLPTGGTPPFLFYLSGLVMWNFFAASFSKTSDIFAGNAHIFSKVYFPRLTVPVAALISNLLTFAIQFILFLIAAIAFGYLHNPVTVVTAAVLTLPLAFYTAMLGLGIGLCVSSLTTRFRDLGNLQGFALQLWMYATPVIYPVSLLPINLRVISIVNPMAAPVTTFRGLWLGSPMPDPMSWIFGFAFTAAMLLLGLSLFSHTQRLATDTI
jgi:lipopolysaccharide transport system permease protein